MVALAGQGGASGLHEALLTRQDAELRLLDSMRRCLAGKVKCDREFATALQSVAAQGGKTQDELADCLIAKAWRGVADGLAEVARIVRQGADTLESQTLPALRSLQEARRDARRNHHEEHQRLSQHLSTLAESVQRKRHEYQKQVETYKNTRARFEEQYVKTGRSGPKIAEVRDKYQRACRRLHLTHNEYVLLLSEASEFERDFRTELLPALLRNQQKGQMEALATWKGLLEEVGKSSSSCSKRCNEICTRMVSGIATIDPEAEYRQFLPEVLTNGDLEAADHVSSNNKESFPFDESLCEDSSGKLLPNTMAVDNLTVDWLRSRLVELEAAHRDAQSKLKEGELQQRDQPDKLAVVSLRCAERRAAHQAALLKAPLSELGCEELPPGCDLALDTNADTHSTVTVANSTSLKGRPNRFRGLFSKPFSVRGKGNSVSTTALNVVTSTPSAPPSQPNSPRRVQDTLRVSPDELVVVSGDLLHGPSEYCVLDTDEEDEQPAELLMDSCGVTDQVDTLLLHEQNQQQQQQQHRLQMSQSTCSLQAAHSLENIAENSLHQTMLIGCTRNGHDDGMGVPGSRGLSDQEWFHGVLPREEVVRLLREEGDFLVRETTRNEERQVVLSVCWGGHKHFIVQTTGEGLVRFEGPAFESVPALIAYQLKSGLPVTARSQAILRRAVRRERWELNNDDVMLVEKIGRGNFGDVYKACLRSTGQQVAVKTCRVTLPEEQRRKFLQEGRILKQYDHPNVVRLVGICVQKQPIMIVMELVPGGSLLTFLRNNGTGLTCGQLLRMCRDAAAGMRYLESRNCIHRDLAARNCLVGYENIVKISDFGMSREEEEYIVSDGMKQIPIKWTAPEALNFGKYTSLCDVWSYGVLAWEIFARGGTPYPGLTNTKAREKIDEGYRMPASDGTPPEMYQLMLRCWEYQPEKRPHFRELHEIVCKLCETNP